MGNGYPDLLSPSLYSALRASLWLSKIVPDDFVATLHPGYIFYQLLPLSEYKFAILCFAR